MSHENHPSAEIRRQTNGAEDPRAHLMDLLVTMMALAPLALKAHLAATTAVDQTPRMILTPSSPPPRRKRVGLQEGLALLLRAVQEGDEAQKPEYWAEELKGICSGRMLRRHMRDRTLRYSTKQNGRDNGALLIRPSDLYNLLVLRQANGPDELRLNAA